MTPFHRNTTWHLCPCGDYFRSFKATHCDKCRHRLSHWTRRIKAGKRIYWKRVPAQFVPLLKVCS